MSSHRSSAAAEGAPLPATTPEDLPPTEAAGRPRWTPAKIAVWVAVALLGGVAWTMLALHRGETINAIWFVFAAVATFAIGYRFYSKYVERMIVHPDDTRATPAEYRADGRDYVATDRRVLYGHHFAAIAGAGPLVGPVLAAQMGYLPGTIWIIVGVILAGAVQDYLVLFFSMRRGGRSLGQMARDELGRVGGTAAIVATLLSVYNNAGDAGVPTVNWVLIAIGLVVGVALGIPPALKTKMTAMPQLVALFNGVGGGTVALIAWAEYIEYDGFTQVPHEPNVAVIVGSLFAAIIGSISFWGSLVAFAKLQELLNKNLEKKLVAAAKLFQVANVVLAIVAVAVAVVIGVKASSTNATPWYWIVILLVVAGLMGLFVVFPIGGADMPVVISLLNALTGLSAAAAGLALNNQAMIVAGLIAGASVFDVYRGDKVAPGQKSVAVEVVFQPRERTLTDADLEAASAKVVAAVAKATGAALRG